ncbi:MAG: hypothetical protein LBJ00_13045 [Planctomycetaceae bacterium]|nr:hypothetical protein [Planctomycetaceae bacterium]
MKRLFKGEAYRSTGYGIKNNYVNKHKEQNRQSTVTYSQHRLRHNFSR